MTHLAALITMEAVYQSVRHKSWVLGDTEQQERQFMADHVFNNNHGDSQ